MAARSLRSTPDVVDVVAADATGSSYVIFYRVGRRCQVIKFIGKIAINGWRTIMDTMPLWMPIFANAETGMYLATDINNGHELYVFDGTHEYSAPYEAAIKFKELHRMLNHKIVVMHLLPHQIQWLNRFQHIAADIRREQASKSKA